MNTFNLARRELLQSTVAGALGVSMTGWFARLAQCAEQGATERTRHKRCILLWMDGGPSHIDTFDPKPEATADVRGPFNAIESSVPGIQIGERFPRLAQLMKHFAIVRGMSTEEADHGRARTYLHTGYKPGVGGLTYPGLGSIVSSELGQPEFALPNFVITGSPLNKYDFLTDPGYLGPRHGALVHYDPGRNLDNLQPLPSADEFQRREAVLAGINNEFASRTRAAAAETHRTVMQRAVRLMRAEDARAFDISLEPTASREAYGDHDFGRGCLLARRLVEVGVPFVEVYLANWDTHEKKSADAAADLMPIVDRAMSTLVTDLAARGLLDSTLIIWMGEFGRTPQIKRNGGRDHFAKAWSAVFAGGGIRGGQVIGRTNANGSEVVDRRVSAPDFMATVCRVLGIDPTRQIHTPIGRPVRLVDQVASPIEELP
jgi:hypothetical protein